MSATHIIRKVRPLLADAANRADYWAAALDADLPDTAALHEMLERDPAAFRDLDDDQCRLVMTALNFALWQLQAQTAARLLHEAGLRTRDN